LTYLNTPRQEVEAVYVSPFKQSDAHKLSFLVNVDGRSELRWDDKGTSTTKLPGAGVVSALEYSRDGLRAALVFDGARANSDIWVMQPQLSTDKIRQLTFSSRGGIPFTQLAEPALIEYETFDKRKIPAWFYRPAPKKATPPPVIVYP